MIPLRASGQRMRALAALAALVALLVAAPAHADEASRQRALELYDRGKASFQAGRFDESLSWLQQAYALEPAPVLLYNMGRAHEGRGDLAAAITAYERYLHEAAQVPDRAAIEAHLVSLRTELDERERRQRTPVPAPPQSLAQPPAAGADAGTRSPSAVPWVIAGVGVAGVGAGVVLGVLALGKHDDAQAAAQVEARDLQDGAETLGGASTAALILGGVAAGVGISWGLVDLFGADESSTGGRGPRAGVAVGPLSLAVRGSF